MSKIKVKSPNEKYSGVSAGVRFVDGVGEFDPKKQAAAARYFERHGYTFTGAGKVEVEPGLAAPQIGRPNDAASAAGDAEESQRDAALGADPGEGQLTGELRRQAEAEKALEGDSGEPVSSEAVSEAVVEAQKAGDTAETDAGAGSSPSGRAAKK